MIFLHSKKTLLSLNLFKFNNFRSYTTNNFSLPLTIKQLLKSENKEKDINIKGWIKTVRFQKKLAFIELSDGSNLKGLQLVLDNIEQWDQKEIKRLTTGSSIEAFGKLVESPGLDQPLELMVSNINVLGDCDPTDYPLQKKRHGNEFLREQGYLRPRTNGMASIFRVRSTIIESLNETLKSFQFIPVQTPIITSHDCEGGGEVFQLTTLGDKKDQSFFSTPAYLTVSSQLHLEMLCNSLSRVYTLGPTFRSEPSTTSKHLAEFWMLELEMGFIKELKPLMDVCESMIKNCIQKVLTNHQQEIELFDKFGHIKGYKKSLLEQMVNTPFNRITYTEAIDILLKCNHSFQHKVKWGNSLQSEHENYLATTHFNNPVFVTDYPNVVKPFYMLPSHNETVACFDLLIPNLGELVGGSLRDNDPIRLANRMEQIHSDMKHQLQWYLNLRKYGKSNTGGFGLGMERFIQLITNTSNIRDLSPYPRFINHCKY